jgi:hypothetical protein
LPDKDGVEIYKRFYPWPDRFRLGDPVLVKEITGMRWPDFVAALNDVDEDEAPDQVVLAGLIAVAFWQGNPQMSRDKARRAVEKIPQEEIEIIDSDVADEGDAIPPAPAGAGNQSSTTSSESAVSPAAPAVTATPPGSTSDATPPNGSGSPGWLSPHPESLPA